MNTVSWEIIGVCLLAVWLLVLSVYDFVSYRLPNVGTVPLLVAGLAVAGIRWGWTGLAWAFLGATVGVVLGVLPFLRGGFGAGDVKLLAGCGAIVGPVGIVYVFSAAVALLGLWSLVIWMLGPPIDATSLIVRGAGGDTESAVAQVIRDPNRRWKAIPFGPLLAIAMAGVWWLF
ncbi:MAG: prepilin peptidase [Pirellulaceae bacterium]